MNLHYQRFILLLTCWIACLVGMPLNCATQDEATVVGTVSSPDGSVRVELLQKEKSVYYKAYKDNELILSDSRLGISFSFGNYERLTYLDQERHEIDETYTLPSGKMSEYHNRCNELEATFSASLGKTMRIVFRVFNEGLAYRYSIDGNLSGTLSQELSEVAVNDYKVAWSQKYSDCYETTYNRKNWEATQKETDGQGSPVLVETGTSLYLLLTEAENRGTYATSRLIPSDVTGNYRYLPEGRVSVQCPFESPWRVVMLGTLKDIVESAMIENLNPDAEERDWSWVLPGRTSWNWGGEDMRDVVSYEIAVKYVDMAAHMGWEYFLLDDGWDSQRNDWNGASDVKRLVNYANEKSVGVLLWTHQNRFANDKGQMNSILGEWKSWGIKGVKADFWEGDTQQTMQKYDRFMEATAEQELLVDLHGCTRPSGTRRIWPHLLTSEAVYGGEMYLGNSVMLPPSHNVMLTLTRNVVGPMDYTPGEFGTKWGAVSQYTSWAHQLALLSLYESGIQCYVDNPDHYRNNIAESYLKDIPAAWDEIRCLEAKPEAYVTLARRKGDDWYVASICNDARTLSLALDFLEEGRTYYAYIYKDGGCKAEIAFSYQAEVNRQTVLNILLLASGGASVRLSTSAMLPKPWQKTLEAEDARTFGKKETDADKLCSGGKYVSGLGRGNKLQLTIDIDDSDQEEQYALTLFYMTDGNKSAYLSVNGESSLNYDFASTGGVSGKSLAMKTFLVDLKPGTNTIEYGNAEGLAPNVDRMTLKRVVDARTVGLDAPIRESAVRVWAEGTVMHVESGIGEALCTLYSVEGKMLQQWKTENGTLAKPLASGQIYIVNVNTGKESYSKKVIIR